MKIEDYNGYYIQGSDHYLIPKDVFIELFNEMINWKEEVKELRKQLEEYQKELEKADSITQSCIFNGKEESKISFRKCLNILDKKETQQKEFINYLEDEIKRINPKELDIGELNLRLDDIKFTQYLIYKEILQKYKSIIGVSDEKEN